MAEVKPLLSNAIAAVRTVCVGFNEEGEDVYVGLNTAEEIATGVLNATAAPDLFEAVSRMEAACERLAAERSPQIYGLMIEQGQSDNLLALDEARRDARAALSKATTQQEGR